MSTEQVRRRVQELGTGADPDGVIFLAAGTDPRGTPSHQWVVTENRSGAVLIGGSDRGEFAAYEAYDEDEAAAQALHHLLSLDPPPQRADLPELRARASGADSRVRAATTRVTAGHLEVGTPLDHIGNESGHYLYLLDTPMPDRALPPTDLNLPRTGYLVARPLPAGLTVQLAPPWFGQPGGGVMIRLERVIAVYVENGFLERFSVSSARPLSARDRGLS